MVINLVHKIIKKGVTVQNRNPLNYLWWRRGDLNSRPPPCEGDALPAELLPHMDAATRRSVVCMPFMCRGQVFFVGGTSGGRGWRGQRAVPVTRVVFPGALFWRMRAVSMPGRPRNGNAAPGPPGRQRPHGPERRAAFPGSPSSGHALQKNRPGRPCGAWLPRKKTL